MSEQHDAFHARGRRALLAHEETWEAPPDPGSPRWGISLLLRPDSATEQRLGATAAEVSAVAGGHWQTGGIGSAHLTVRVLEPYRDPVPPDDPLLARYIAVAARVARRSPSPQFAITGLLVGVGGVVAAAEPANAAAAELRTVVATELDGDGKYEPESYRGEVWWSTLLHFSGPVADGAGLVDWVEDRGRLDLGRFEARSLDLVRYEYDGARTAPVALCSVPLEG